MDTGGYKVDSARSSGYCPMPYGKRRAGLSEGLAATYGYGTQSPRGAVFEKSTRILELSQPALFMTVRCVRPIATEAFMNTAG